MKLVLEFQQCRAASFLPTILKNSQDTHNTIFLYIFMISNYFFFFSIFCDSFLSGVSVRFFIIVGRGNSTKKKIVLHPVNLYIDYRRVKIGPIRQ